MTPDELQTIRQLIETSSVDPEQVRRIVDDSVEKMEGRLEKAMDSKFKQLEEQIAASTKHSEDLIRNRVSDKTCEHHRESTGQRIEDLNIMFAKLDTSQKTTGKIVLFILGMLIPAMITGIAYGINIYGQLQSLLH